MSITKATALDLATRNDGYLVRAGDPDVVALKEAGLVYTRPAGDGWWIARVIVVAGDQSRYYRGARLAAGQPPRRTAAKIGAAP